MDLQKSTAAIQVEATRFRSAVSEALLQRMGGLLNYLRASVLPIGSYCHSNLTLAQFQGLTSNGWVLADGADCTGSDYALLTGNTTVPNAMGVVLRGKNNGRSSSTGNQSGELALGTYQGDAFQQHTHQVSATLITETSNSGDFEKDDGSEFLRSNITATLGAVTGNVATETRVRSVTANIFFRIN